MRPCVNSGHTVTLLKNGKVLVGGGDDATSGTRRSAEVYDPLAGTFTATGNMITARDGHIAILLPDGKVLIAGGVPYACAAQYCVPGNGAGTELYNPSTGTFTAAGDMTTARRSHKATLLPDGSVLMSGGYSNAGTLASAEMQRRDSEHTKTRVALTDGERALQILVDQTLEVTLILDLLHVLEKLWKAAYVFHAEGSPEAEVWVRQRTLRILCGGVSQVVKGLRQSITKRRLFGAKRKTLAGVAGCLHRNHARMRYDHYLAQGWPIASGPVEGACKNLIKDRMERSGMRWTEAIAEAIIQLKAIYLSGDFDRYWSFHIEKDQQRIHPPGQWSVVLK